MCLPHIVENAGDIDVAVNQSLFRSTSNGDCSRGTGLGHLQGRAGAARCGRRSDTDFDIIFNMIENLFGPDATDGRGR